MNQHWMRAILCLLLMTVFFVCAEENTVRIDEGGLATWTAIPDAVMHECKLFNAGGEEELRMTSTEPSIYAPPTGSYYLYVRPVFENGECGD